MPVYISPSKRFIEDLLRSRPAQEIRRSSSFIVDSIVRTTTIKSLMLFSVIRRHSRVFWTCAIRSFISLHQVKSSNHSPQNKEWELPQTHSIEKHFDYLKQSFNVTLNLLDMWPAKHVFWEPRCPEKNAHPAIWILVSWLPTYNRAQHWTAQTLGKTGLCTFSLKYHSNTRQTKVTIVFDKSSS